jgi:trk system potassium uptake protein TrkA
LEEAGIKKADVLVVATREDETNLLVCLVAKEVLKEGSKLKIISRASKDEYKKIFLKIGVDNIVSPETSTIEQLEDIIEPEISDLGKLYKSMLNLVEFEVGKKSEVIKKPANRVEFPEESLVIAIKRKDQFIIPGENEKFEAGDKVIMVLKKTMQSRIEEMFKP